MPENLTPASASSTAQQLLERVEKKIIFSFLCFLGFFLVALTAAIPFNMFVKMQDKQDGSLASFIPVIVSSSFLLGILACAVALIIMLSATDIKRKLTSLNQADPDPQLEENTERGLKKLCTYQITALALLVLPICVNLILTALTVW